MSTAVARSNSRVIIHVIPIDACRSTHMNPVHV